MKSLIKTFSETSTSILLRNTFKIKPVYMKTFKNKFPITVSDAFLWRTNNGYKTKIKYSDILNLFYNIKDSWVELHFYSKSNKLIKIKECFGLEFSNEFEITSEYLDNIKDYGIFYIYHFSRNKKDIENESIISNRCYLGYSQNNNLYSFVHGNTLAKFTEIYPNKKISSDIIKISMFKNYKYTIQKYFDNYDKNELIFTNPTSKLLKFTIEKKNYRLSSGCAFMIKTNKPIITIQSNCLFFRPTIFSYKEKFIDVHHS